MRIFPGRIFPWRTFLGGPFQEGPQGGPLQVKLSQRRPQGGPFQGEPFPRRTFPGRFFFRDYPREDLLRENPSNEDLSKAPSSLPQPREGQAIPRRVSWDLEGQVSPGGSLEGQVTPGGFPGVWKVR